MAWLHSPAAFQTCRRILTFNVNRYFCKGFHDPMEHVTGPEKREVLAGNEDLYNTKLVDRLPDSSKECPNLIPSVFEHRIIGCICEEDATSVNWMWLHNGCPKRCECGHWFKLVQKTFH